MNYLFDKYKKETLHRIIILNIFHTTIELDTEWPILPTVIRLLGKHQYKYRNQSGVILAIGLQLVR